ncbi:hypothetical protein phiIBB-PF7Ap02 [Pseudomonas phage phiIBB-PF7A]|uniref:Uncharacterized protein n=1 Tax=Pseudomonas phage phiIBB-PF7A TaxID=942165 RepID=E9KID7_9CAUD|nr:hypothetical protein phiIBB-PF7Ap02 [Pseudomonas phage phiIBB-PF7A]ADV35662.1 hypothetical protein phiIBB-PF7Ap02 [Pseudomonas phage phiIBB-PF7A]
MIALNYTSFTSREVAAKILAAMQEVRATGNAVRVLNRRGKAFLLVTIHKDALGYAFKFIAEDGTEVGQMIQRASNDWDNPTFTAYWSILSWAWDLKEHPLLSLSKLAAQAEAMKGQGATHKVTCYGGTVQYGAYQRDWLCRRRLYLFGKDGVWRKVDDDQAAQICWIEVLK